MSSNATATRDSEQHNVHRHEQTADSARNALVIENLRITYGKITVVNCANLTVAPGEFLTLLGPSGSGKTSILRAVAGYVHPAAGDIRIGEYSVIGRSPRLRNCGMVFQSYALFPHMTVAANIAYGLRARRVPKHDITERVAEVLEVVHLQEMQHRYPHQLSGGQQQRVALARAIVIQPDLLLMDEPLAALDLRLRERLQVEIRRLQQRFGISTLYVTHDQGEAFTMSDRVIVMNAGDILSDQRPRDAYLTPSCSFTARFVGSSALLEIPIGDAHRARLPGHPQPFRLRYGPHTDTARIYVMLRPEAIQCRMEPTSGWSQGTIVARRFVGMNSLLVIDADGYEIFALDPIGNARPQDHVWFNWSLENAHVIEETTAGLPCNTPAQQLILADET